MSESKTGERAPKKSPKNKVIAALIPVAMFFALVAWGFASPVGASPDDDYHLASIWCGLGDRAGLCEPAAQENQRRVPAALLESSCFAFKDLESASCQAKISDRLVTTKRGNFTGDYPPVYYGTLGIFAGPDINVSVLLMRAFNAFLFVGFATALFLLMPRRIREIAVWPAAISVVPLGMFLIPSVNPSSWALLSAAGVWVAVAGYFESRSRGRKIALGAIALVLAVMGSGARSDAAVYVGIAVVVAMVLTARRSRNWITAAALPVVLVIIALAFFFSSGQSGIADPTSAPSNDGSQNRLGLALHNLTLLPSLWAGVFGTWPLGWLDTPLPPIVWVPSLIVFGASVFVGLRVMNWRKAVSLALVFGALILIPLYILVHDGVEVGVGVQPRYIFPLLIVLAGLAMWPVGGQSYILSGTQLGVIVVSLSIANAVALHTNIRRYVTGMDVGSISLSNNAEWWWTLPFGPNWVWLAGSVFFGAGLSLLAYTIGRPERRSELTVAAK